MKWMIITKSAEPKSENNKEEEKAEEKKTKQDFKRQNSGAISIDF